MFTHSKYSHMTTNTLRVFQGEKPEEAKARFEENGWRFPADYRYDDKRRVFVSESEIANDDLPGINDDAKNEPELNEAVNSVPSEKPNKKAGRNFKNKKPVKIGARVKDTDEVLEEEAE